MKKNTHTIDATGRTLGRVASEAAKALMGKMSPEYTPNVPSDVKVTVTNASKIFTRERKKQQKTYTKYSGFPGGLKKETLAMMNARKPGEAVRRAVQRMLPRNTMLVARMKNLTITQ